MAKFQLIRMSSCPKNKLLMCLFTQHQCRRNQICGKRSQIQHSSLTFYPLQKTTCHDLNNLFMARFQLISMSSYATEHTTDVFSHSTSVLTSPNVWKMFTNSPSYTHIWIRYKKRLVLIKQSIRGRDSNSLVCPLMLKTNYRSVQSLNISVDDAKCVENVHKSTKHTHFLSVTKNDLSWLNNLFMPNFQHTRMVLLC